MSALETAIAIGEVAATEAGLRANPDMLRQPGAGSLVNARMDTATALKASLALTDAPRLPPPKLPHESWFEYRRRASYLEGRYDFENFEEWLARKGRTGGLQETREEALRCAYQNVRDEWKILSEASVGWPGLNSDQADMMEAAKERSIELFNEIYGTEY